MLKLVLALFLLAASADAFAQSRTCHTTCYGNSCTTRCY